MAKVTKRAVLVGCDYANHPFRLPGCIRDALDMRDLIVKHLGFVNVKVLSDEAQPPSALATAANIKHQLTQMVESAKAGDVLFFYFSGHGTAIPVLKDGLPRREEKAIVSADMHAITGLFFRQLVNQLPEGATFTIVSDSGHSGGLLKGEKVQIGPKPKPLEEKPTPPGTSLIKKTIEFRFVRDIDDIGSGSYPEADDGGILLSGCAPEETSYQVATDFGTFAFGAFTKAVLVNVSNDPWISNKDVVKEAQKYVLHVGIYFQHPCLYCSDANADAPFLGGAPKNP
ncbi:metacaspase-9-like isoform X2 [Hibiscus syriacus]|uniref:metacaspase-9-like isoform X2 n=1 Tax=Hibiscus syriacus TaxID=106335 RepID=UPI001923F9C9|nr:metacaspase-9-like isoform X2 [Hibiscus syriacus]